MAMTVVARLQEVSIATIQIVVPVTGDGECADFIAEAMRETPFLDWQYLKVGGQFLYGTSVVVNDPYTEGEAFND